MEFIPSMIVWHINASRRPEMDKRMKFPNKKEFNITALSPN